MASFLRLPGTGSEGYYATTQEAVSALENITAAEKAQAVPHFQLWRIRPDGKPVHGSPRPSAPLSMRWAAPPPLGAQGSDVMFRERPPVSFERASIKTINPRSIILYREVELSFVVHRPDVVFGAPDPDRDNWSDLLIPGYMFCLEYGWSASPWAKNPIVNGEGIGTQLAGIRQMRFTVYTYDFTILPDMQLRFTIKGLEDGEQAIRQSSVVAFEGDETAAQSQLANLAVVPKDLSTPAGQKALQQLQDKVRKQLKGKAQGELVRMEDVLDVLLADRLQSILAGLGYKDVQLYLGNFNDRSGTPGGKFSRIGDNRAGGGTSGQPGFNIGDFQLPISEVTSIYGRLLQNGGQTTVYAFLEQLLDLMNGPDAWDTSGLPKDETGTTTQKLPRVTLRTSLNPRTGSAAFYIVDMQRDLVRLVRDESKEYGSQLGPSRTSVRQYLAKHGVPVISMLKGNSFITNASFNVEYDDQMKSVFIRRFLKQLREGKTKHTDLQNQLGKGVSPTQLLYSSAIRGEVTALGNFAVDALATVWLDFRIPRWDGPFFIMEVDDVVDRTGFTTTWRLQSEGDDPLGTQRGLNLLP